MSFAEAPRVLAAVVVAGLLFGPPAAGQEPLDDRIAELERLIEQHQEQINALRGEVSELRVEASRAADVEQIIERLKADPDFRLSGQIDAGYDKGFYIRGGDEFFLRFKLRTQFRYVGVNRQSDDRRVFGRRRVDDINGFEFERLRFRFEGHLFDPKFTYLAEFDGDTDGANDVETLDLWTAYEYAKGHKITFGQRKPHHGRQELTSAFAQQFVDRSMANEVFNLDRAIGIEASGELLSKKLSYYTGIWNGFANQNDDVRDVDTNFAYTARLIWHVLGEYGKNESDLEHHEKPALELGTSFAYNNDNNDTAGPVHIFSVPDLIRAGRAGIGAVDPTGTDYYQFGLDGGFKYRGFSTTAEYWVRTVDSDTPLSAFQRVTGISGPTHYQGGNLQVGYFLIPKKLEVAGRLGGVWDLGNDAAWEYGGGATYYIKGQSLKVSADVMHTSEAAVSSSAANYTQGDDMTMFRVQLQASME